MATISVTSTYSGDALKGYILAALLGGETLSTNGISVETGIKYKRVIKKLAVGDILQNNSCDFSPTSGVTLTEAVLEPCKFKINEQICFEDLMDTWSSNSDMPAGANNDVIPADLNTGLVDAYVAKMAETVEEMIWQSDSSLTGTTVLNCFDGYELLLSGSTQSVTGTTLTVSNIVTEMNKVYEALPSAVAKKGKSKLIFFMSHKAAALYEMNLASQGINTTLNAGVASNIYGIEIKPVGGLSNDNIIVLGERANFYVGTDLASDFNEIKIIDLRETTGDEAVRFILKAKLAVAIAYPLEVVFYKP